MKKKRNMNGPTDKNKDSKRINNHRAKHVSVCPKGVMTRVMRRGVPETSGRYNHAAMKRREITFMARCGDTVMTCWGDTITPQRNYKNAGRWKHEYKRKNITRLKGTVKITTLS
jgi:hypothetical protein